MSDYNEFFDDMIDVDDEPDADPTQHFDGDDEEEEEEDDGATVIRSAVLTKNGMIALLSLRAGEAGGRIVRLDPRESLPAEQRYQTEGEAVRWFGRSLATSRRNGWVVVYDGAPLVG